jgi:hypothetical protein
MPPLADGIDVGLSSPEALRSIARHRHFRSTYGHDILLTATDATGAHLALNFLIALARLRIAHHVVLSYDGHACSTLAAAAVKLSSTEQRRSLLATPCVRDLWWERHLERQLAHAVERRLGTWFARWSMVARLVRLGYNVLSADTDVALLDNPYPYLHSASLCGRFAAMFGTDYGIRSTELQNGIAYTCGARRDGATAWVLAEAVDRYLRLADACGGAYRGDRSEAGTRCPPGSWLHAARMYGGVRGCSAI